jgi:hypothetical protein
VATIEQDMSPSPGGLRTPDLYQLQGAQVHVTYATTGLDGKPHLTYQDATQTLTFDGDQIRTAQSEIGTLVTVTTRMSVDTGSTSFSVLIPNVNLGASGHAPISTDGVTTIHRFSVVAAFNQGQTELYSFVHLTGTASFVLF